MSVAGASIVRMRKDGRPLVTEFPIDPIDYVERAESGALDGDGRIMCSLGHTIAQRTAFMSGGVDPDDDEQWIP